jgi:hypothetical protein
MTIVLRVYTQDQMRFSVLHTYVHISLVKVQDTKMLMIKDLAWGKLFEFEGRLQIILLLTDLKLMETMISALFLLTPSIP